MGIDKLRIKSNHTDIVYLVTEGSGMSNELPTIVMVHGAWADGSSWTEVIKLLSAEGYRPVAALLPLTSLADDVAALGRAIDRTTGPLILVAHAYAGAVIGERLAWKDTPSWFLVAQDDRMIVRDIQEFMAKRMHAHVHSQAVDHAPLITAPQLVADMIRTAALSIPAA